ncbi:beta-ribofuranosylaminobenzene 5'-phosphate synthase family protein [Aquisphaera insulae]|uniref:beta-ribofuranosylaminobenzene 5'-phosphate synthase family protein n=1 Tax=Aquisphaera insulae TaxID=2712864 RepID=UPI0013EC0A1C|nr:beta-ribofuranosylaminobenzene 5'-phosphate synthase family protein [Aquisphaera insulae]
MSLLRIRTPGRLHFGLLGWGKDASRQFGGVGLMIESPGVTLAAERSAEWAFLGPLADRVETIVRTIRRRSEELAHPLARIGPMRIEVLDAPAEHVGLGLGTQLSLAVLQLCLESEGLPSPEPAELARLSGRGQRSGIGLHGFLHGGLIVDGGRSSNDHASAPPLLTRLTFPEDWSILLVQPHGPIGRHGEAERNAFSQLPPTADRLTDHLCRLVLLGILPAVIERDLRAFGSALSELQQAVGRAFATAQGGTFASPQAPAIIEEISRAGLVGAGQTSWGPSLYGFGTIPPQTRDEIRTTLCRKFGLPSTAVIWTAAANHGAEMRTNHRGTEAQRGECEGERGESSR